MIDRITPTEQDVLAVSSDGFEDYLRKLQLPIENIIASNKERGIVLRNFESLVEEVDSNIKKESRYLSKFISAAAIGLFDAALNYIWNEVVLNLRKKAINYDLSLFYDSAVGGQLRENFKDESNLEDLKDNVLLATCKKLELISEFVYTKLSHILTMRNQTAASHPSVEKIHGLELCGWLQTCITDVIKEQPSESAIQVQKLITNLKKSNKVLTQEEVRSVNVQLRNLSSPHVQNLLLALFSIYIDPMTEQILEKNISQIAPTVWNLSKDNSKVQIGIRIESLRANLQQDKARKGSDFLTIVKGREYETISAKTLFLDRIVERLTEAHHGYNNYHREPSIAEEIIQFCKSSADIPKEILPKLVKIVVQCRVGRGIDYQKGVSTAALKYYSEFLNILNDNAILEVIHCLSEDEIRIKLENEICREHVKNMLTLVRKNIISDRLRELVDDLVHNIDKIYSFIKSKEFKRQLEPLVRSIS
jgi:hypothetical protein